MIRDRVLGETDLAQRGLSAAEHLARDDVLWPGQLATLAALLLFLALPDSLSIGPVWTVPAAEALALGALVFATRTGRGVGRHRTWAILLVLLATAANLVALGLLVDSLLSGDDAGGSELYAGGGVIWGTSLLLFAVLYWELDRGGPLRPGVDRPPVVPDLLFPQMTDERFAAPGWMPRFVDYLYVSLTNQTAFSPTDTMPLTPRVKILMVVQGLASLVTIGVIVARAVNLLA
jgi:hypothetical protein